MNQTLTQTKNNNNNKQTTNQKDVQHCITMTTSSSWFQQVFGFIEPNEYEEVRKMFRVIKERDNNLILETIPSSSSAQSSSSRRRKYQIGKFTTPSVQELQSQLKSVFNKSNGVKKQGLTFQHIIGNVKDLHLNSKNNGAVFQVASQF